MPKRKTAALSIVKDNEPSPGPADELEVNLPRLKLTLRLMHGVEIAFGPGKADLLEAIARTGSISAAGKSLSMSYRRAWLLVDVMNHCFQSPLVETAKGGSHGGGARLTALGEIVLRHYRTMEQAAKQAASAYLGLFENLMAEAAPPLVDTTANDAKDA